MISALVDAVSPTRPPRRGRQRSLFQLRQPAFWFYVLLLAAAGWFTWVEQDVFERISPTGFALSWLLLLLYGLPAFLLIHLLDLYKRHSASVLIGAVVWGGIAATTVAGFANEGWGLVVARLGGPEFASRWSAALTAPWVEETAKVIGVVLIYLIARDSIRDPLDGFVLGAVCGLGFAIVEDVFYFVAVFGGKPSDVLVGFFVRALSSGLYGHPLFTGVSGMGIAYFVTRRGTWTWTRRYLIAGGLFTAAMVGHFLWDSPWLDFFPASPHSVIEWLMAPAAAAVKGIPLLAFAVVMVTLARRRERWSLWALLASEAGGPGMLPEEIGTLLSASARRRARRAMHARAGRRAAILLGRLQREQLRLALIHDRVEQADHSDIARQREYCASLRRSLETAATHVMTRERNVH